MLRQTTRALAGMGGRAAGASAPGSAFAPHAAAGASWMQNRSIGKVGVPENYGQIDGVGTKFLGTPANHREVRHERIGMSSPRVSRDDSPLDAVRLAPAPVSRGSRAGVVNVDSEQSRALELRGYLHVSVLVVYAELQIRALAKYARLHFALCPIKRSVDPSYVERPGWPRLPIRPQCYQYKTCT